MSLKLTILPRAQEDAQCIYDYLAERSPQGASDWWACFESADRNAALGMVEHALAPENVAANIELRQVVFKLRPEGAIDLFSPS